MTATQPTTRTSFESRIASYSLSENQKINAIISSVFEAVNIKHVDIKKLNLRSQWLLEPIHICIYLIYTNTNRTLSQSAIPFGVLNKHHATALNAIKKTQRYIDNNDTKFCSTISKAKKILKDDYNIELSDKRYTETSNSKRVNQFTEDGIYIKTHVSAASAARTINKKRMNISNACIQGHKTAGFRWKYEDDKRPFLIKKPKSKTKKYLRIIQSDIENNEVARFKNSTTAGQALGINRRNITKAIKQKSPIKGYWFEKKKVDCI